MIKEEVLHELLHDKNIKLQAKIEDLGSELSRNFIQIYLKYIGNNITFDDFRTLIKLSVGYSNIEKLAWIQEKATDEEVEQLQEKIASYKKSIKNCEAGKDSEWRLDYTSSVSKNALLALNMNKKYVIGHDSLPKFLENFTLIIRSIIDKKLDKEQARENYLNANFTFPPYINSNTLANILFVLQPQAFPLTNNHVRQQIKSILGISLKNTAEDYIKLAKEFDGIADANEVEKDFSMAIFDRIFAQLQEDKIKIEKNVNDNAEVADSYAEEIEQVTRIDSLNTILFGAPGTGKTFRTRHLAVKLAEPVWYGDNKDDNEIIRKRYLELSNGENSRIQFTTFHQSFAYEDFIEGLKANTINGSIQYEIENGIFKEMALQAKDHPKQNYVLIIDEINRGNISRIFGELITLLEDDKRLGKDEALEVKLPYSKDKFGVPENLYIIGTMNTADKSLAQLDLALRRRFSFVEMMPNTDLLKYVNVYGINLKKLIEKINNRIQALIDRDHVIGHAYFMPLSRIKNKDDRDAKASQIFKDKILPLLQEYFYDDWESILRVLGKNSNLLTKEVNPFQDLSHKSIYQINIDALTEPEFYKAILSEDKGTSDGD